MRVEIKRGDSSFAVLKTSPEQTNYTVENLPAGRELLSEYEANGIASVLAGLKFDDVAKAESAVPDPSSMIVATFRTFDGLVIEITGFASEGKRYATFAASVDGARADLAAKAAQLNAVADHERATKAEAPAADSADPSTQPAAELPSPPLAVTDPAAFIAERRKAVDDEATKLNALLILMKDEFAKKPSSNTFGEGDALKSATSRIEGNDVVIEATFPPTALDGAAKLLAGELKKAKTKL